MEFPSGSVIKETMPDTSGIEDHFVGGSMRTSTRTGMALAVAGAASGLTLLSGGAVAGAATAHTTEAATTVNQAAAPLPACRYVVTAKHGLAVRMGPGVKFHQVGTLKYGAHITADCKNSGWTQLRGGVPQAWIGKWVSRTYLRPLGCGYTAVAKHGLAVRTGPGVKYPQVGTLKYGTRVNAECKSKNGWVRLYGGVPQAWIGKWVSSKYLRSGHPVGRVDAGGGGTSMAGFPMLAGAGAGVLALGGGIAVVTRRRQVKGVS